VLLPRPVLHVVVATVTPTDCLLQGLSRARWSPWQRRTLELYRWRRWCYWSSGSGRKSHVQDTYMHGEMSFVYWWYL